MAPRRILPNAENASLQELETAAACTPRRQDYDRIKAIITLLHGVEFDVVAKIYDINHKTLSRWIANFNDQGVSGLIEAARSGRPRAIAPDQVETITDLIERPDKAGHTHWTGKKFHGYLTQNLVEKLGYSTLMRFLGEQDYRLKVPQPWPDRQDEPEREAYIEQLGHFLTDASIDLWFADESGFEGDPRPRRRFAKVGSKPRVTKNGDHLRMNVTGAVCPRTGEAFLYEFSHSDTECFQFFLDRANESIGFERPINLLVLDNASWHKNKSLRWGRFQPLYLPAYSPDLNAIERLWLTIKSQWFADFIAKSREQLEERLDRALQWATNRSEQNRKTCAIKTKL